MDTVTFACPHCRNLMAVSKAYLGRNVRCPTCKGVVQAAAPAPAPAPVAPPVAPPPPARVPTPVPATSHAVTQEFVPVPFAPAPAPPPAPAFSPPEFAAPPVPVPPPSVLDDDPPPPGFPGAPVEGPESIFGDQEGDDLFNDSRPLKPEMPSEPQAYTPALPPPPVAYTPAVEYTPPAAYTPPPSRWSEPADPFAAYSPPPAYAPPPAYTPPAQPAAFTPSAEPPEPPAAPRRPAAPAKAGVSPVVAVALAAWAAVATAGAVYGLFLRSVEPEHPFKAIPDVVGEYDSGGDRKKVSRLNRLPNRQPVPAALQVPLGESLTVNQLRVRPVAVERRTVQLKARNDPEYDKSVKDMYLLRVELENVGDAPFHPSDPALARARRPSEDAGLFAGLEMPRNRLYYLGGYLAWPDPKGVYATDQAADDRPLGPGEKRQTAVLGPALLTSERSAFTGDTRALWRLHLRTGRTRYNDREYGVTSVVGVAFDPSKDIKTIRN